MDIDEIKECADYVALDTKYQKAMTLLRSAYSELDTAMLEFKRGRSQHAKTRLTRLQERLADATGDIKI